MNVELLSVPVTIAQLGLGATVGWWLCTQRAQNEVSKELEKNRQLVREAQELASTVVHNVGDHRLRIEQIGHELDAMPRDDASGGGVRQAIDQIVTANDVLRQQLATAEARLVEQARQLDSTAAEARIDALTGLANRRAFDDYIQAQYSDWFQNHRPLCLLMIDVDFFKRFNDRHGHQIGDAVLRKVAGVLRQTAGKGDFVARFGGEEFAIVVAQSTLVASALAELVRHEVEKLRLQFPSVERELHVTISLGLAQIAAGDSIESFIGRADQALYAAKHGGRNCSYMHNGITCDPILVRTAVCTERRREEAVPTHNGEQPAAPAAEGQDGGQPANRRRSPRRPLRGAHPIAPYDGERVPSQESFFPVRCHDIATGGFSFVVPMPVTFTMLVVTLGANSKHRMMAAEVRNQVPVVVDGQPMVRVGCRFTHRIDVEIHWDHATA